MSCPPFPWSAWPLVVLGLIFASVGLARVGKGKATNKGLSIAGIVVSIVGLVVCVVWVLAFNKAVDDVQQQENQPVKVVYDVTGTATNVQIEYMTFEGQNNDDHKETAKTLPWQKEVQSKGSLAGGGVIVTTDENGGTVTCKVTVDGQVKDTQTQSGPYAVAACTGF